MTYHLNEQEIRAVLSLDGPKRYNHFIKRVTDWEELWTLKAPDGYVLMGDKEEIVHAPVWPHLRYAEICARGEWSNTKPVPISLSEFLNKWIPGLHLEGRMVAVFPLPTGKGIAVDPVRLADDLREESTLYED